MQRSQGGTRNFNLKFKKVNEDLFNFTLEIQ